MLETKLAELQGLAMQDSEEAWGKIEAELGSVCNDPAIFEWACTKGMFSREYQLQDLSASILERAKWLDGMGDMIERHLVMRMQESVKPEQKYAKFRIACALFNHGYRNAEVVEVLQNAPDDVTDIAAGYLKQLD